MQTYKLKYICHICNTDNKTNNSLLQFLVQTPNTCFVKEVAIRANKMALFIWQYHEVKLEPAVTKLIPPLLELLVWAGENVCIKSIRVKLGKLVSFRAPLDRYSGMLTCR